MTSNPNLSPNEDLLSQHSVCAFGNIDAFAQLLLTNRCLKLVFSPLNDKGVVPPIIWKIQFSDISQIRFKQDSTDNAVSLTIVSKASVCGQVPVEYHDDEWLRQNRDAIKRKSIGVSYRPRTNGGFSYRLPEGWFFDESGCCLSVYLKDMGPEEACKLSARIFAVRDTGLDSESYAGAEAAPNGLFPWLSGEEKVIKRWSGDFPNAYHWWNIVAKLLISTSVIAPTVSLTRRRLIVAHAWRDRVFELTEYPIDMIRSLCWLTHNKSTRLKILTGAQIFDQGYEGAWEDKTIWPASVRA